VSLQLISCSVFLTVIFSLVLGCGIWCDGVKTHWLQICTHLLHSCCKISWRASLLWSTDLWDTSLVMQCNLANQ